MRINTEPKLNFEDVLLQPKRSTLSSRRDVDMTRKFTFRNSGKVMDFLPIFASNMDGVGTFEMADKLAEGDIFTCLVKTYSVEQLVEYFNDNNISGYDYLDSAILPDIQNYSTIFIFLGVYDQNYVLNEGSDLFVEFLNNSKIPVNVDTLEKEIWQH